LQQLFELFLLELAETKKRVRKARPFWERLKNEEKENEKH